MSAIYKIRAGTSADLESTNPNISGAEICIESDSGKIKFGPGAYNDLDYLPFILIASDDVTFYDEFESVADQDTYTRPALNGATIKWVSNGGIIDKASNYSLTGTAFKILNTGEGIITGTHILVAYIK